MAADSDARWKRGEPLGPVDGVPTSVKDVLRVKGWPTRLGSKTVEAARDWDRDAPSVQRMREAGAVFIGMTATPEMGWKGVTDSPLYGATRNPWNLRMTPGGSSGGAAAAVACGVGPLAFGTDGGGSVRIPAAFCGIVALKPSFGRGRGLASGAVRHALPCRSHGADGARRRPHAQRHRQAGQPGSLVAGRRRDRLARRVRGRRRRSEDRLQPGPGLCPRRSRDRGAGRQGRRWARGPRRGRGADRARHPQARGGVPGAVVQRGGRRAARREQDPAAFRRFRAVDRRRGGRALLGGRSGRGRTRARPLRRTDRGPLRLVRPSS